MAEPAIVAAANRFKAELLAREERQMEELARMWVQLMDPLESEVQLLALDFAARQARGDAITQGALFRLERAQVILAEAQQRTQVFNERAGILIVSGQREIAQIAIAQAGESIARASAVASFERLPISAVESMFGVAGDGQPIAQLLAKNYGPAGAKFARKMQVGTALGWNPAKTAREAHKQLQIPLQRAMVTTRTEQNRVHRETTRISYQRSRVVEAQMRLSARDIRVCPACLFADGEIIPLGKALAEHPQGRCTTIPLLVGEPLPDHQKGREWFLAQKEEAQREILGDDRYEAWRGKQFDLSQLVGRKEDPEWGESLYTVPLRDLSAAA